MIRSILFMSFIFCTSGFSLDFQGESKNEGEEDMFDNHENILEDMEAEERIFTSGGQLNLNATTLQTLGNRNPLNKKK